MAPVRHGRLVRRAAGLLRGRRGESLIEVVVSIALFAVLLLIFGGAMLSSLEIIASSGSRTQHSMDAAGGADQAAAGVAPDAGTGVKESTSHDSYTITFGGGVQVTVPGSFVTSQDGTVAYTTFQPDGGGTG